MIKISIGGINEIKYPVRNNHDSDKDFIQRDAKCGVVRKIVEIKNVL
jgi:hypothetical protein